MTILLLLLPCILFLFYLRFRNVFQPGWTSRRSLPKPKQPFWLLRLFHEPNGFELERWSEEVAHEGVIRYFGIMNEERIFAVSPRAVKDLLVSDAYKFIKPRLQFELFGKVAARGLVLLEGQEHKDVKKCVLPAFKPARMNQLHPVAWQCANRSVDRMANNIKDGKIKILRELQSISLETMGKWAYSTDLGALEEPQSRVARLFSGAFRATKHGEKALTLASIIGPKTMMWLPIRAPKTLDHVASQFRQTCENIVVDRERKCLEKGLPEKDQHDLLDTLIASGELSHEHIVDETVHFLAAAGEMPATLVSWVIHLLSRYPDVQSRLRSEVQNHFEDGKTANDLDGLQYLNAVIEETMRVHHLDTVLWREVAQEASLAGTPVHPGVKIVWSPWILNRDEQYWGSDAEIFRPERWLEDAGGKRFSGMFSNANFGIGPRRCIGEQYARITARCMVASFVNRLEFAPVDASSSTDVGMEIGSSPPVSFFKVLDGWELQAKAV